MNLKSFFTAIDQQPSLMKSGQVEALTALAEMVAATPEGENGLLRLAPALSSFDGEAYIESNYLRVRPILDKGGMLIVPLVLVMNKNDYWGVPGTRTIGNWLNQAAGDERVKSVLLYVNSPGGAVDGTPGLAAIVGAFPKKLTAYIDGMGCSGALYVYAAAKRAFANSRTDILGSCGSRMGWIEYEGILEQAGAKVHDVYATTSPGKNFIFREAKKGEYGPMQKTMLDPIDEMFMAWVKEHRPSISKEALDGYEYMADAAIEHGLIDEIASFDDVLTYARLLPDEPGEREPETANTPLTQPQQSMEIKFQLVAMLACFGQVITKNDDGTARNEEALASDLSAKIEAMCAENLSLKTQNSTAQDQITNLTKERDDAQQALTDEKTAHEATREAAKAPSGAPSSGANPQGQPMGNQKTSANQKVAQLPHIKAAMEALGTEDE